MAKRTCCMWDDHVFCAFEYVNNGSKKKKKHFLANTQNDENCMYTWVKRFVFVNILWLSPYSDYWKILHYWCTSKAIFLYNVDFRWNILVWQCSWSVQTLIYLQTGTTGKSGLIQRPSCVWWRLRALYMQFSWRLFNLSGWPFCNSKQFPVVSSFGEGRTQFKGTDTDCPFGRLDLKLPLHPLALFLLVLMRRPPSLCLCICRCKGLPLY